MEWKRWLKGVLPFLMLTAAACPGGGNNNDDPVCGDGVLESDGRAGILEFCDDGNTATGDGCDANCRIEFDAQNHVCDLPDAFLNGFGGCCNDDTQCVGGGEGGVACIAGICTFIGCTADADCQQLADQDALTVNAVPHPPGTTYGCADIDGNGICVAGSGKRCEGANDDRCAADETCMPSIALQSGSLSGNCAKNFLGAGGAGEFCTGQFNSVYECGHGSLQLAINCFNNTCVSACDPQDGVFDNAACSAGFECVELGDLFQDGGFVGGGYCLPASCGVQELGNPGNENIDVNACGAGQTCNVDLLDLFFELDLLGDGPDGLVNMRCALEAPGGVNDGDPCENDPFFGQLCHDAGLCLQAGAVQNAAGDPCFTTADCCADPGNCDQQCVGAVPFLNETGNCSARPDPGICSSSCAQDSDCDALTDGLCADIGLLTVFDPAGTPCVDDADCGVGEVCDDDGGQAAQSRCSPTTDIPSCFAFGDFFADGTEQCAKEDDCTVAGEGCIAMALGGIGDRTLGGFCADADGDPATGNAVVGDACAGGEDCLSAFCLDENFDIELADGTPSQTFCGSLCTLNADCGSNQVCAPVLTQTNDFNDLPGDGADDTVIGLCAPINPADPADVCSNDVATGHNSCEVDEVGGSGLNCVDDTTCQVLNEVCFEGACRPLVAGEGDSCNVATGTCFTAAAVVGSVCQDDVDCDLGGSCLVPVLGADGFCVANGCDSVLDAGCPGANDTCLSNGATAPGTCLLSCNVDGDCQAVNPALTCQDTVCALP